MTLIHRSFFLLIAFAFTASMAPAQVQTGTPPFGSFSGGPEAVNNANLNVHWMIPILHKPGRGTNFTYDLTYDSSVWSPVNSGSSQVWSPVWNWGWAGQTQILTGYVTYSVTHSTCGTGRDRVVYSTYTYILYVDQYGTSHSIGLIVDDSFNQCPTRIGPYTATATLADGSGYALTVNANPSATVYSPGGTTYSPPLQQGIGSASFTDRNGNKITADSAGNLYDTLSSTTAVLTIAGSGTPSSPKTFGYTAPSGSPATYTVRYSTYTVQTTFSCSGVTNYGPTSNSLVSEIDLPDNSKYTFAYEATLGGTSGAVTGRLMSVTLPTGGTITYTYLGGDSSHNGITCKDGSAFGLKRATPDTGSNFWEYDRTPGSGAAYTTTISDPTTPTANQTVIQFQGIYETQRQVYQGSSSSGTLLATTNTCYNGSASPCNSTAVASPINQRTVITTLQSAGAATLQSKSTATYNSAGVPTEIDAYAFGSGAPPTTPTRKTIISYASLGNITAFQQTVTVEDGNNNVLAQTNYNYDETTPVAAPTGTPQLVTPSGPRGNLTSVQNCTVLSSCSSFVKSTMTYDTAGQLQTVKDPLNNQTTFSYADNYLDDDGSNPPSHTHPSSAPTDAFPTTITPPLNGALTSKYYYYSGQRALSTDQNNNTGYSHFQDLFARLTSAYGPVSPSGTRPWKLINYTSPTQADTYADINDSSTTASSSCTVCRHDQVALDSLGRAATQELVSDPEGATFATTSYDSLGRVKNASHRYRTTNDSTYGFETPTYDALGRSTKVTHQDNTYSQTLYGAAVNGTGVNAAQLCSSSTYGLGFPVLAIDEAGKEREFWTDGLGRTIEADEPDSNGNLTSNTCYSYDPLGNLLQIVRSSPSQTRTYGYDALSRVTSVSIPELANCSVTYTYDSNSNLQTRIAPAPNQASCTSKVTTTYSHDSLNRFTGKTYSDTTPAVTYFYDQTTYNGLTITNGKGRRTGMSDSSGTTAWSYDSAGKVITEKRTILGVTKTISYSYNLDGSIAAVTYPSTNVITYTVSNAQRLTAAKDVVNSIQFATAASYASPGGLSGVITGQISGGFGGITESHSYDNSLEYTSTQATSSTGTALNLTLNYNLAGGDNGTVTTITNNVSTETGRTQTLTYDPLNRIASATTQATSGVDCWGQNFIPDAVANLNTINNAQCNSNTLSVSVDANNHINSSTTFAYDAAGNMTQDGKTTGYAYFFDGENRLAQATGMSGGPYCYVYDGNGLRVAKKSGANSDCTGGTVTKLYWRSIARDALAETDGSGNTLNEYVFFAGRRIASRDGSGHIFYWFADQLGSTRTITTGSGPGQTPGQLCYDADFTPYGQEISYTSRLQTTACPPSYKFTGYERDPETAYGAGDTGIDYAFARYYSSRLGRFLSTDPLGGSIGDLQSHNAYAYTRNNPLNSTDPSGMTDCPQGKTCWDLWDFGFWNGRSPMGLGGSVFDILLLAFTPTDFLRNIDTSNYCLYDYDCGADTWSPVYGNWGLLSFPGGGADRGPFPPQETKFPPKIVDCTSDKNKGTQYLTEGQLMTPDGKPAAHGATIMESNIIKSGGIYEAPVTTVTPDDNSSSDVFRSYLMFNDQGGNGVFTYHWEVTYMYKGKTYSDVPTPERTVGCVKKS
jgi:RHS repeat-associated protein